MKNMKYIGRSLAIALSLGFSGCGGGNDSSALTGVAYYNDTSVQGLVCTSGSTTSNTDTSGSFVYEVGKSVSCSLGNILLPTIAAGVLSAQTPYYQLPISEVRTGMLLQSLDNDNNLSNGIQISKDVIAKLEEQNYTSIPVSDNDLTILVQNINILSFHGQVVSETDAAFHLKYESIKTSLLNENFRLPVSIEDIHTALMLAKADSEICNDINVHILNTQTNKCEYADKLCNILDGDNICLLETNSSALLKNVPETISLVSIKQPELVLLTRQSGQILGGNTLSLVEDFTDNTDNTSKMFDFMTNTTFATFDIFQNIKIQTSFQYSKDNISAVEYLKSQQTIDYDKLSYGDMTGAFNHNHYSDIEGRLINISFGIEYFENNLSVMTVTTSTYQDTNETVTIDAEHPVTLNIDLPLVYLYENLKSLL